MIAEKPSPQAVRAQRAQDQFNRYTFAFGDHPATGSFVRLTKRDAPDALPHIVTPAACSCEDWTRRCADESGAANGLRCKHQLMVERWFDSWSLMDNEPAPEREPAPVAAPETAHDAAWIAKIERDRVTLWD